MKFSATIFSNLNSIAELKKDNLTNLSVYLHKCEIKKIIIIIFYYIAPFLPS